MEAGATCRLLNFTTSPYLMKLAHPTDTTCMLCDALIATEHSVGITAVGMTSIVSSCPECYAMFSDFRIALELMPRPQKSQTRLRCSDPRVRWPRS